MGPLSGNQADYGWLADGPPYVVYFGRRQVKIPRMIRSEHHKCKDGWRCQGPGCIIRSGKTAAVRGRSNDRGRRG